MLVHALNSLSKKRDSWWCSGRWGLGQLSVRCFLHGAHGVVEGGGVAERLLLLLLLQQQLLPLLLRRRKLPPPLPLLRLLLLLRMPSQFERGL
jgi:hypothetical protein